MLFKIASLFSDAPTVCIIHCVVAGWSCENNCGAESHFDTVIYKGFQ